MRPLSCEGRVAGYGEQIPESGEPGDDVLGEARDLRAVHAHGGIESLEAELEAAAEAELRETVQGLRCDLDTIYKFSARETFG